MTILYRQEPRKSLFWDMEMLISKSMALSESSSIDCTTSPSVKTSLAILSLSGSSNAEEFGGTLALARIAYGVRIIPSLLPSKIDTTNMSWKISLKTSQGALSSPGETSSTPTPSAGQTVHLPKYGIND